MQTHAPPPILLVCAGILLTVATSAGALVVLLTSEGDAGNSARATVRPPESIAADDADAAGAEPDEAPSSAKEPAKPTAGYGKGGARLSMTNVALLAAPGLAVEVERMTGGIRPTTGHVVDLDHPDRMEVVVDAAEVRISAATLQRAAWSASKAPVPGLEGATVTVDKIALTHGVIEQQGHFDLGALHVPFTLAGTLSPTPEGDLRVEVTKLDVGALDTKSILETFAVDLKALVKDDPAPGVKPGEGLSLTLSIANVSKEPKLVTKVRDVRIEEGAIVLRLGDAPLPDAGARNALVIAGGNLRFGKMSMKGAVAELVDPDPTDPLLIDMKKFEPALFASIARATPDGIRIEFVDADDVKRAR
jgi:hypothetical protein